MQRSPEPVFERGDEERGATFDFQLKKENSETKVGSVMNLEGGLGGDFLKGGPRNKESKSMTSRPTQTIASSWPRWRSVRGWCPVVGGGPAIGSHNAGA